MEVKLPYIIFISFYRIVWSDHIDTIDKFNVTSSNLVQEKYGKISTDY